MPAGRPRTTSDVVARSPGCRPLRDLYHWAVDANVTSWNQVEERFLEAMSEFDTTLAATATAPNPDALDNLVGDLQNGKGDFFNDLLSLLLEGCSGIEDLYARASVPGLLVEVHNLDGVYPSTGEIGFLLEAKMMGTPKHALNRKQKDPKGRRGSADIGKRVKELAFKSIDLKGEASRRRTIRGERPVGGGAGGGDLTTWLRSSEPRIYFILAARVINDADFAAIVRWCGAAAQVVDAVGLYCYEPLGGDVTTYRRREGVPPELALERTLYKACLDLQQLNERSEAIAE
jgi:hypothetical protein